MTEDEATPHGAPPSTPIYSLRVGFWSAILVAFPLVYTILVLAFPNATWLMSADRLLAYIFPLAVLALFVSASRLVPPDKRARATLAVCLAFLFACSRYLSLTVFISYPQALDLESRLRPLLMVSPPLEFACLALAGLLAMPAFWRSGLGRAIRWSFAANGVFFAIGIAGYVLQPHVGNVFLANLLLTPGYLASGVLFPVTGIFVAAYFQHESPPLT